VGVLIYLPNKMETASTNISPGPLVDPRTTKFLDEDSILENSYIQPNVRPTESKNPPVPELENLITNLNHTAMEFLRRDYFPEARDQLQQAEYYLSIAKSFAK
jgi:hypothetical protein